MGERAFFQIAVGLLPVLLFGGTLVTQAQQRKTGGRNLKFSGAAMAVIVPVLGMLAILAEIMAIGGAIGAKVSPGARLFVISMILLGMALVVLSAALPRFRELVSAPPEYRSWIRVSVGILIVLCIGFTVIAVFQVNYAIKIGNNESGTQRVSQTLSTIAAMERRLLERTRRIVALKGRLAEGQIKSKSSRIARVRLHVLDQELRIERQGAGEETRRLAEYEDEAGIPRFKVRLSDERAWHRSVPVR